MIDTTVLILAGGDSTRFWPLREKLFTEFCGKPLLYYRLKQLNKYEFKKIVIVGNKENQPLFSKFLSQYTEFSFDFLVQTDPRGMAGAVVTAREMISGKKILVIKPVDIVEDFLFEKAIKELNLNDGKDGFLTGMKVDSYFPGGYLTIEGGFLTHITEKPGEKNIPSDVVRIVFDYFENGKTLLDYIEEVKTKSDDHYEIALEKMAKDGKKFKVLNYDDYWGYLTYPWHVLSVMTHFLSNLKSKRGSGVKVAKTATIIGPVVLEDGVRILENSKVVGPAYIGKNTLVGNNCVVRESMVGAHCVVGFTTEITRSYVGNNSWFHTNYIGDSVIGENVGMGGRVTVANFRLDEKSISSKIGKEKINSGRTKLGAIIGRDVRIGVGAMIMPGVKVGKGSFIGSGVLLDEDLAENKAIFVEQKQQIKENIEDMKMKSRESLRHTLKM